MVDLTSNEKGAVAEAEVATAALHLGFSVSRPIDERRRYDLIVDTGRYLARVQCKWGRLDDGVVKVGTRTSRHTPLAGYVSTTYSAHEIDGFAVFCPDTVSATGCRSNVSPDRATSICAWRPRRTTSAAAL